jgi:hypothetical protein
VSQKELKKVIMDALHPDELKNLHEMKPRIAFIGDIVNGKKLSKILKELSCTQEMP